MCLLVKGRMTPLLLTHAVGLHNILVPSALSTEHTEHFARQLFSSRLSHLLHQHLWSLQHFCNDKLT